MSKISKMKLGDIGKISMCKRILKSQTSPIGEVPFYKISTFGGKADCFITRKLFEEYKNKYSFPKKGEILISAAGTLGKTVVYNGEEAFFQDSNIVWVDNDEKFVLNDFLYYYYQLKPWKKTTGSTIERLYNNNLRDINVVFPTEISEQKKIINVLKTIDNKIKNNNKINKKLEQMVKTIYDYWFLQYEFPNQEGKPYKSSGGKMVWNELLKKDIPSEWSCGKIGNLIKIGNGKDHKNLSCGNIPVYGSGGIIRHVNQGLYKGESILIPRKGTLNNIIYVNGEFWTVDTMFYSIPKTKNTAIYTYYSVKLYDFEKLNTGTGVPSMTSSIISNLQVIIPRKDILQEFDKVAKLIYNNISTNNKQNEELIKLRDYLLPLLMNGQIGFKN